MRVWVRFALLALVGALVLASFAFCGVKFAEKPVKWMPAALGAYFGAALIAFVWAISPVLAGPTMAYLRPYARWPLRALAVLVLFPIFAYLSFCVFCWLWLAFGGEI
jgi:hypothetical protein